MAEDDYDTLDRDLDDVRYLATLRVAEAKRTANNRREALRAAIHIEHGLPSPMIPDKIADCPHPRGEDCDCDKMTADEHATNAQLIEEATADRIMRNAQRFAHWINGGYSMADEHHYQLLDMLDRDDDDGESEAT